MDDNPLVEMARRALHELIQDEPLGVRARKALKHLQPILDEPAEFDHGDAIVGVINKANDAINEHSSPGGAARSVAEAIEIIFRCVDPLPVC